MQYAREKARRKREKQVKSTREVHTEKLATTSDILTICGYYSFQKKWNSGHQNETLYHILIYPLDIVGEWSVQYRTQP
ncbi:hypothetical protein E2C01_041984 [Portunus trituberculatus]|uniref:Uncharacterized protein n=1 Tax=Portunus trituberculatus TaxID=210409 RepID=A0A5B7FRT9_PORTR|nr:hypothetical protein [Portunus trituberculatus]